MNPTVKCSGEGCDGQMVYVDAHGETPAKYRCGKCKREVVASCVACKGALKFYENNQVHSHYVDELAGIFDKMDYKVITEGGIPEYRGKEWGEPDIFVLRNLKVEKIVEIAVGDFLKGARPRTIESKCRKIKEYYNPPELIVFMPTKYVDSYYNIEKEANGKFKNYDDYNAYLEKEWKNQGLAVSFWNETKLQKLTREGKKT